MLMESSSGLEVINKGHPSSLNKPTIEVGNEIEFKIKRKAKGLTAVHSPQ
jgi:hypothetical protein